MPEMHTMSIRHYPEYAGVVLQDSPVSNPAMCEGALTEDITYLRHRYFVKIDLE